MYAQSEIACVGRREPVPLITHNILFNATQKRGLAVKASSKPCSEDRVRALESIFQLRDSLARAHYCVGSLLLAFKSCDI